MLTILRRLRHGPLAALGPIWLWFGRIYRKLARHLPGLAVSQKIGAYGPFRLSPEFAFSDFENWGSAHNRGFRACIEASRGKHCVLDVGAHIGLVSVPIASVLAPGGTLYSFEPAEANARILERHLQLNRLGNVEVTRAIVGSDDREAVGFYEGVGPHGQNSIVLKSETALNSEVGGYLRTSRKQLSLDSFCRGRGVAPEVIKIDVEGAEINVLKGARQILTAHRPLVYLSVHPREIGLAGGSMDELAAMIAELGYEIRDFDGNKVAMSGLNEYLMAPRA